MVDISISLIGSNDDVITFDEANYILTTGLAGFGIPATSVRIDESAADGGIWRHTRRGIREIDMPIFVAGSSHADVEQKLRRLANLLHDHDGPTTIRATYASGETWEISGHYVAGAETTFGEDAGLTFCKWVITLQCPTPFWVRGQSESFSIGAGVTGRSLIPNLAEMRVSSSQALGAIEVENPGDIQAYPTWTFKGPIDQVTVTNAAGVGFTYNAAILLGSTVTVDAEKATVVDQTGANKYGNLSPSPKFFTIPAGSSVVTISATGATSATLLSMFYRPRKEVVH